MEIDLQNPNPIINNTPYQQSKEFIDERTKLENDPSVEDPIDKYELYEIIRTINDPEHPLIKVRTWQPEKDPKFGLYGPGDF